MDENVTEMLEPSEEVRADDTEFVEDDTEFSSDDDIIDFSGGSDSVDYSGDIDLLLNELYDKIQVQNNVEDEEEGVQAVEPLYPSVDVDLQSLIDDDLGGVPVVDVTAVSEYAGTGGTSYQLPAYYVDYFSGVLSNLGDTEYVCFCAREYPYNNDYWVEHYRLVYNIVVDDDSAVSGDYPCIDIYRYSSSSNYNVDVTQYSLSEVPAFSYGSFGTLSDLRKGVTHDETWAVLFFLGFFAVYSVCRGFFRCVERLRRN